MMMNYKIGLFCCDIYNTYYYKLENHNDERNKFINNLQKIIKKDNLKELLFSFITNDNSEFLNEFIEDIKYHLPDNIKLVEQFFYGGFILEDNNNIFYYSNKEDAIKYLDNKYKPIKIYYADDVVYNHNLDNIIHFIPGNNKDNCYCSNSKGLNGLNESIEKYLEKISII